MADTYFRKLLDAQGVKSAAEFLPLYRAVAATLPAGPYEEPAEKTVEGWLYKGRRPQTAFRAVIVAMLGQNIPVLWGPPPSDGQIARTATPPLSAASPIAPHAQTGMDVSDMRRTGAMAVRRARKFLMDTDQERVGETSLALLQSEVERLVRDYPRVPLGTIWDDLLDNHDQAIHLLETGRFAPRQLRDVNFLAATLSFLVAKGFNDMEDRNQARTMTLVAASFAKDAEHPGLIALVHGLQSLVEYWADRPTDAFFYAQKGAAVADNLQGTVLPWLLGLQARAAATLGNEEAVYAANRRATELREHVVPDELDRLGGLLTYSAPKQAYYTVEAQALLPASAHDSQLIARAEDAVSRFADNGAADWAFGDLAGARCNLALVRLVAGDIEGSSDAMRPVLQLAPQYRNNGIVVSASRVRTALTQSPARQSIAARDLSEEITAFPPQRLALGSGAGG